MGPSLASYVSSALYQAQPNLYLTQSDRQSAIDTGTTLIGVPHADAVAIYAQIPGAQNMSASSGYQGYYMYPCNTRVSVALQFGGLSYTISDADFSLGPFTRDPSMCTGAFFEMDLWVSHDRAWTQADND